MMNKKNSYKLIIVGGGASGLAAAISAAAHGVSPLILERNAEAGKKITATGNGKCNYTNMSFPETALRSSDLKSVKAALERFDNKDTIAFFKNIGILPFDKRGYIYPYSGQAVSVRNALVFKALSLGCEIKTDSQVTDISRVTDSAKSCYRLTVNDGSEYFAERLVIAAGGMTQKCFGCDGTAFGLLEKLGIFHTPLKPALTGLKLDSKYIKTLNGVRHEAEVSLLRKGKSIYSEFGECIFNKTGASGIPVMNMSRYAKAGDSLSFDFFPDYSEEELEHFITERYKNSVLNVEDTLNGLLNNKLLYVCLLESGIDPLSTEKAAGFYKRLATLSRLVKNLSFTVNGDNGFDNAQVTCGGIAWDEIKEETFECRRTPGIYLCGEMLDVDGMCGGYNLQWAWTSGAIAGACAAGGYFDKDKFIKA